MSQPHHSSSSTVWMCGSDHFMQDGGPSAPWKFNEAATKAAYMEMLELSAVISYNLAVPIT